VAAAARQHRGGGGQRDSGARWRRRQRLGDSAAAVSAAWRRWGQGGGGGGGGGSTPAAAGLVAAVAVSRHCSVSFENSATFMASDQEPSGGHARHVRPFSDARNPFFGMSGSRLYSVATGFDSEMTSTIPPFTPPRGRGRGRERTTPTSPHNTS
jgi:hypothetical protein